MGKARVIQQTAEGRDADGALADVLMAIQMRAARSLSVIHMPHADALASEQVFNLTHRRLIPFGADDIVAGHVSVAGIETGRNRRNRAQAGNELRHLLQRSAQRELGAGGVLDQEGEGGPAPRVARPARARWNRPPAADPPPG